MKARRITGLICAAVLGILAGFWGGSGTGEALFSLSTRAGEGLRALSLTGFLGNLSAWAIILAVFSASAPAEASQRSGRTHRD